MIKTKYLIIGGGVAGTTAAETIRQNDSEGRIIIVSDEPYRFYSRIMLSKPNWFLGKIPFEKIYLKTPEFYAENKIELLTGKKAIKVFAREKTVALEDGETIIYEKLLLAIGGCARLLAAPGADKKGVYPVRTLDDGKNIIGAVKTAKQAVCVGGGFVSFEMADMLKQAGLEVTVLLREPYYWANLLDEEAGAMIEEVMTKAGTRIFKNEEVLEVLGGESVEAILTKSGKNIPCQIVIAGIGLFCPVDGLRLEGVETKRGIITDEYLETSAKDVWAAGDAAEFQDVILEERPQVGTWANAQAQGRTAGLSMTGKKTKFELLSSYATSGFGLKIAFIGDARPSPDKEIIKRGSKQGGALGRLFLRNNKLIGGILFNRTDELAPLSKLIVSKADLSQNKNNLADPNFDLKQLLESGK